MTTPWRSVQDAEKANETVAWQALPCRLSGGRVSTHRKLALAHVIQLFAAKWRKMRRESRFGGCHLKIGLGAHHSVQPTANRRPRAIRRWWARRCWRVGSLAVVPGIVQSHLERPMARLRWTVLPLFAQRALSHSGRPEGLTSWNVWPDNVHASPGVSFGPSEPNRTIQRFRESERTWSVFLVPWLLPEMYP